MLERQLGQYWCNIEQIRRCSKDVSKTMFKNYLNIESIMRELQNY